MLAKLSDPTALQVIGISDSEFRKEIAKASADFRVCWKYLCAIKSNNIAAHPESITDFQPRLATTIVSLSRVYSKIAAERKRLIVRKGVLSNRWFVARQRLLSRRQETLDYIISTGRCLGDAFAWFFYQRDRHYLRDHLSQPAVKHLPTGIGGIGELEFVKRVRHVNGRMMLYHGTTSILRLGDFSLIDLARFRVAGFGELKSWSPQEGVVQVRLTAIGPGLKRPHSVRHDRSTTKEMDTATATPSAAARDRFHRQLKRIEKAFKKTPASQTSSMRTKSENHMATLTRVVRNARRDKFTFAKADNGLLLMALRSPHRSLLASATSKVSPDLLRDAGPEMQSSATSIMDKNRNDNSIYIGTLLYRAGGELSHLPGMTHPFWWDLPLDTIRALVFHDVLVMTLFNPAHVVNALERAGFAVEEKPARHYRVTKQAHGHRLEVNGMDYFLRMIHEYMFTEAFVTGLITNFARKATRVKVAPEFTGVRVDLVVNQEIGGVGSARK